MCNSREVIPTKNPPCVDPSDRSESSAASEIDTVRTSSSGIGWMWFSASSVCLSLSTERFASSGRCEVDDRRTRVVPNSPQVRVLHGSKVKHSPTTAHTQSCRRRSHMSDNKLRQGSGLCTIPCDRTRKATACKWLLPQSRKLKIA